MTFRFPLQPVLRYRLSREEEAKQHLDRCRRSLEEAEQGLRLLHDARDGTADVLRKQYALETDFPLVQCAYRHLHLTDQRLRKQEELRGQALQAVRRQQEELRHCWQHRRILEILQDSAYREHRREEARQEQKTCDELALYAYKPRA